MKKDIHPKYFTVETKCSTCGKEFVFGSSKSKITIDVCSGCHPVYTGDRTKNKATGRVERFKRMYEGRK